MQSHPAWVRGLKLRIILILADNHQSHPAWVRGLKHVSHPTTGRSWKSHPAWVGGLKNLRNAAAAWIGLVAPCVGAWIET